MAAMLEIEKVEHHDVTSLRGSGALFIGKHPRRCEQDEKHRDAPLSSQEREIPREVSVVGG
jgi:hypothetical protein